MQGKKATIDEITVIPSGTPPFVVRVKDGAATATLGKFNTDDVDIDVRTPFAFRGRARKVALEFGRAATLAGGLVRVVAGTPLDGAHVDADHVLGTFWVADMTAHDVELACADLALGAPPDYVPRPGYLGSSRTRGWAVHDESPVRLFAQPGGAGPSVLVSPFVAAADRHAPGWVHVVSASREGSVQGWVARDAVDWIEELPPPAAIGEGGCGCGCLDVQLGPIGCLGKDCHPEDRYRWGYVGPALVEGGTTVYSQPGGGAWARVSENATFEVSLAPHTDWVAIRRAHGVSDVVGPTCDCDGITRAYVPRGSVRFPTR